MSNILLAKRREVPNTHKFDSMLSWFNSNVNSRGFIKGVSEVIHTNFIDVTNTGATETNLHTFTIPANTLFTNNDFLDLEFCGFLATNTNTKSLEFELDRPSLSTFTVEDSAALSQLNGGSNNNWLCLMKFVRLSSTSLRVFTLYRYGFQRFQVGGVADVFGAGYLHFGRNHLLAVSDLATNSLTIRVTGQGTATGDVHQTSSVVRLTQNA